MLESIFDYAVTVMAFAAMILQYISIFLPPGRRGPRNVSTAPPGTDFASLA